MCQPLKRCAVEPEAFDSLSGAVCIGVAVDSVPGDVELVVEGQGYPESTTMPRSRLRNAASSLCWLSSSSYRYDLPVALWRTFVLRVEWT
ncbi:hypothetical protein BH78_06215 [Pseudomonas aeruginosa C1913C]|nr:hypothetical protein BH78_06215 [Pseudomonas aeruginosa C1913C]